MTNRNISLKQVDLTDKDAVLRLLQSAGLPLAGVDEHFHDFILARVDGELVGCAGLEVHGEHGLLRSVAVAPDRRRCGVGSQLVDALLTTARRRGLKTVTLLTETAAAYFPRFGFISIARDAAPAELHASAEFQGACPDSAVVMILSLDPSAEDA